MHRGMSCSILSVMIPKPSLPTRSRSRHTTSGGNVPGDSRARVGSGPTRGDPNTTDRSLRDESSGQTARTTPVYLLTVSRPLETLSSKFFSTFPH
ncbi:hypothetical protein chiPu_0022258, partial [Chiloscyllium punctatum]|nr:hypothetical protein [Chiloscyllium punctatum]